MKKLAIIISHPIQYYAPVFQMLAERKKVTAKIFYCWEGLLNGGFDSGFGQTIRWDVSLLNGYDYEFVPNYAKDPGTDNFWGLNNPSLISRVEGWHPDAILVFGWSHYSNLSVMRYFKGKIPIFFRGDSTLSDKSGLWLLPRLLFLKWVYKYIDLAFYVGKRNKEYFLKYGLKENQLVWAPHAVDNERFSGNQEELNGKAMKWRKELGIDKDAIVLLFVGKLARKKNPLLLLNTFRNLADNSYHLVFVGSGEMDVILKDASQGLSNVHFLGFQNQGVMPVIYSMSDVFIFPSQGMPETWGLAVNEAMACGKPVIVSDKAGCSEDLVEKEGNGFVFNPDVESDLLNKIKLITFDKNRIKEMGQRSKEIIKNWSVDVLCEKIEDACINSNFGIIYGR